MPQLTRCLLFSGRPLNPTTEIFPLRFKELLPLKLRNRVSFKGNRQDSVDTCLQQMTEMFECFKKNEFDQAICGKEIAEFKVCSEKSRVEEQKIKEVRRKGSLVPGSETLTTLQANVLLKRYPQNNPDVPDRWSMKKFK